jgi:hypothetical protein
VRHGELAPEFRCVLIGIEAGEQVPRFRGQFDYGFDMAKSRQRSRPFIGAKPMRLSSAGASPGSGAG